ncbi:HYR domain-containing protein, partial [Halobacillus sp. A5]|uniref:HYR domain-containing protein n=1 Tax=Halobacillus sp. A5 TaxID=2880263 RepID=UPI0020A66471
MPEEVVVPSMDYPTIQDGINGVDNGGTVHVEPGLYTPGATIIVNKPVTLLGPQADVDPRPTCSTSRTPGNPATEAIVDGGGMLSTIIRIEASDVSINGLEVRNGTGDLIASLAGAPVKERPNVIYNIVHQATGDEGLQLRNILDGVISYNHVYDTFGDGINVCCGALNSTISYNEVHDIRSPDAAIYVYEATNTTIERNLVYNVTVNDGIKLGDAAGADEGRSGGFIIDNIVHDVIEDGITLKMSDTTIEGNEIYRSFSTNGALFLDYTIDNISITNNCIHDNGTEGDMKTTYGVRVGIGNELPTNVNVNFNNIFNNVDGGLFYNSNMGEPLDAENNWWGSPDGPNTPGGDTVVGNVDYTPFLEEAAPVCNPNIVCPEDINTTSDPGECTSEVTYTVIANSNDCGIVEVSCNGNVHTYSPPENTVEVTETRLFPVGVTQVICEATNASGDFADCSFEVTVIDEEPPEIICPEDVVEANDPGECGAIVTYPAPAVMDNCPDATSTCTPASGSFFPVGTTLVTCIATDASGNESEPCTFEVTVIDGEPPEIICPEDIVQANDPGECGAVVTYPAPAVIDNCPDATSTCTPASGSFFPVGTTLVTCIATDASGNESEPCTFEVTVIDEEPPEIICPEDIVQANDPGECGAVVTYPAPAVIDNCPDATSTCTPASGSFFPVGTTLVTCIATDASGSESDPCSF